MNRVYLKLYDFFSKIASYFLKKSLNQKTKGGMMALTPKQKKLPKGLQEAILKSQKKGKKKKKGKK